MKILIAAPTELSALALRLAATLAHAGHAAVVDAGETGQRARRIGRPDVLILLLAPGALSEGSRVRRHLERAARRWSNPTGRVIPLLIVPTPLDEIPPYLRSVAVLVPVGDPSADVLAEIGQIVQRRHRRALRRTAVLAATTALVLVVAASLIARRSEPPTAIRPAAPLDSIVLPESLAARARFVATPAMPELTDRVAACVPLSQGDEEACTAQARQELERYYFVGAAAPAELLRVSHDGVVVGRAALEGEPRALAFSHDTVYVATTSPDAIRSFVGDSLVAAWSREIRPPPRSSRQARETSTVPAAVVAARETLWLLTGATDDRDAAIMTLGTADGRFRRIDANAGVPRRLRRVGDGVWGVFEQDDVDVALVRLAPGRPAVFGGGDAAWTACADDLADAGGDVLVVSCENEVLDLRVGGERFDVLLRYGRLTTDNEADTRSHQIAAGLAGWTIALGELRDGDPHLRVFRVVPGARPWLVLERAGLMPLSVAAAAGTTFIIARNPAGAPRAWLVAGAPAPVASPQDAR